MLPRWRHLAAAWSDPGTDADLPALAAAMTEAGPWNMAAALAEDGARALTEYGDAVFFPNRPGGADPRLLAALVARDRDWLAALAPVMEHLGEPGRRRLSGLVAGKTPPSGPARTRPPHHAAGTSTQPPPPAPGDTGLPPAPRVRACR